MRIKIKQLVLEVKNRNGRNALTTATKKNQILDVFFNYFCNKKQGENIHKKQSFLAFSTDRQTKYLQNRCSFMRGICTKKLERYLNVLNICYL